MERRLLKSIGSVRALGIIYEIAKGQDPEDEGYTRPRKVRKPGPRIVVTSAYMKKRFGITV